MRNSAKILENIGPDGLEPAKRAHNEIVDIYYKLEEPQEATEHCIAIGVINEKLGKKEPEAIITKSIELTRHIVDKGLSGYVTVEYSVSKEGYVENAKVVESTGKVFNKVALKHINGGRFAPRAVNGKPVATDKQIEKLHLGKDAVFEALDVLKKAAGISEDSQDE